MEEGVGADHFDVVVVGTGIAESIAAATLAKAGHSVLHLDENDYYGGPHASLTLDELLTCKSIDKPVFDPPTLPENLQRTSRRYALSLFPALLPSTGPLIDKLISSDVGKYVTFRILDGVLVGKQAEDGLVFRAVPANKESVFKDKTISLGDKRKLMKFLMTAVGDPASSQLVQGNENLPLLDLLKGPFGLPDDLAASLAYGVAHCTAASDLALANMQRLGRYLRSVGRYGSTGFLVAQYGGAGEIAQAFCRSCAVYGGTYVLGEPAKITSITRADKENGQNDSSWQLSIPAHPRPITTSHIIGPEILAELSDAATETSAVDPPTHLNCIALYDGLPPLLAAAAAKQESAKANDGESDDDADTAASPDVLLYVLQPGEYGPEQPIEAVRILCMGAGTGSCPEGQVIVYLQAPLKEAAHAASAMHSYLNLLGGGPAFSACYSSSERHAEGTLPDRPGITIVRRARSADIGAIWLEGLDWQAAEAQRLVAATGLPVPEDTPEGPADDEL